jgi:enamine deaminase RidA (YjgF/YER057c/UK114 family)
MLGMDDDAILGRLTELGLDLPPPPVPVAAYVPVRISGPTAYVAGQVPMIDGRVMHPGRLGPDGHVSNDEGRAAAEQAALQALSALRAALGSFDRLSGISQVTVYLSTTPGFADHAQVANGASELLVAVLGDEGRHARAAVGMASLPLDASVEVVVTAHLT